MPTRIRIIEITINSSIRVKPRDVRRRFFLITHQSEYLLPSRAVPCDLEYTSKTFFPHQLCESGSSVTHRSPQSACPVIGSTGTFLKKRIFLSAVPTWTPLTSDSRSGG